MLGAMESEDIKVPLRISPRRTLAPPGSAACQSVDLDPRVGLAWMGLGWVGANQTVAESWEPCLRTEPRANGLPGFCGEKLVCVDTLALCKCRQKCWHREPQRGPSTGRDGGRVPDVSITHPPEPANCRRPSYTANTDEPN